LTRGVDGDIYNIGGGNETPNIQLVESILEHIGIEDKSEWIEYVSDRKGHDRRYSVNTEKMQGLGWRPQNDFQSSLSKTVDWYNTNKWWWEPLVRNKNEK
jgi:dTDP-glucose 4,6-dehydratase